ncbi:MAG: hypothetical protein V4577_19515 [Bacteroidota bacterium]
MKKLFLLLFFIPAISKAQLIYQYHFGQSDYSVFTFLLESKHDKQQVFFSSYDNPRLDVKSVRDTTVSGVKFYRVQIGNDSRSQFYLVLDNPKLSLYQTNFSFVRDYYLDNSVILARYKSAKPHLSTSAALAILKFLVL